MSKKLFFNNSLDMTLFDKPLVKSLNNLKTLFSIVQNTHSGLIETTHFLLALGKIENGITENFFKKQGILPHELETGLLNCIKNRSDKNLPMQINSNTIDISVKKLFTTLDRYLTMDKIGVIDEGYLLLGILENLTPAVVENLSYIHLNPKSLVEDLKQELTARKNYKLPVPFINNELQLKVFSPSGKRVIELMKTEAESLGFQKTDPRHLLLALLEFEGGATHIALYQQEVFPKKVQEKVILNLRAQAKKNRTSLTYTTDTMSPAVIRIIKQAAEETKHNMNGRITETCLFRAFLHINTFALRQLLDSGLDGTIALKSTEQIDIQNEDINDFNKRIKKIPAEIKNDLKANLVGQDDVIDLCLPFIIRMQFDFQIPEKPAGVLLFCGPSGSGKTEMAKAIARCVFSSTDEFILLEMGQFQTKESMNIFVGAPPAYIGYGEGKLTNWLRDHPHSVILFDEIEKAHSQVFDALLRFIDEGKIDDPAGPIRDGTGCFIIMTSNVNTGNLEKLIESDSYKKSKWKIRKKLRAALLNLPEENRTGSENRKPFRFRPEFLNRIDEIILFRQLTETDYTEITQRHLQKIVKRLKQEKEITLILPEEKSDIRVIGHFCYLLDEGARSIDRIIQSAVLYPVIDFYSVNSCSAPVTLQIKITKDNTTGEPYGIVGLPER